MREDQYDRIIEAIFDGPRHPGHGGVMPVMLEAAAEKLERIVMALERIVDILEEKSK